MCYWCLDGVPDAERTTFVDPGELRIDMGCLVPDPPPVEVAHEYDATACSSTYCHVTLTVIDSEGAATRTAWTSPSTTSPRTDPLNSARQRRTE